MFQALVDRMPRLGRNYLGRSLSGIPRFSIRSGDAHLGRDRALLQLGGPEKASCREVRSIAAHHLEDIRAKLSDLKKLERLLAKTVAQCSGKTAPDCPVLDILHIGRSK
jgi:MerR family transcriptional regulator, mercuric resistance operon regulatory protein